MRTVAFSFRLGYILEYFQYLLVKIGRHGPFSSVPLKIKNLHLYRCAFHIVLQKYY